MKSLFENWRTFKTLSEETSFSDVEGFHNKVDWLKTNKPHVKDPEAAVIQRTAREEIRKVEPGSIEWQYLDVLPSIVTSPTWDTDKKFKDHMIRGFLEFLQTGSVNINIDLAALQKIRNWMR